MDLSTRYIDLQENDKRTIVQFLAHMELRLLSIRFSHYGNLDFKTDITPYMQRPTIVCGLVSWRQYILDGDLATRNAMDPLQVRIRDLRKIRYVKLILKKTLSAISESSRETWSF